VRERVGTVADTPDHPSDLPVVAIRQNSGLIDTRFPPLSGRIRE